MQPSYRRCAQGLPTRPTRRPRRPPKRGSPRLLPKKVRLLGAKTVRCRAPVADRDAPHVAGGRGLIGLPMTMPPGFFSAARSAPGVLDRPKQCEGHDPMLYAILCYNDEDVVWSWSQAEDEAVMARLNVVQDRLSKAGKLGPSLRLLPTTSATTLRKTQEPPLIIDGPFAETKEQLLGFYVVDVVDLEEALNVARELAAANPGGAYEIRPVALYNPDRRRGAGE